MAQANDLIEQRRQFQEEVARAIADTDPGPEADPEERLEAQRAAREMALFNFMLRKMNEMVVRPPADAGAAPRMPQLVQEDDSGIAGQFVYSGLPDRENFPNKIGGKNFDREAEMLDWDVWTTQFEEQVYNATKPASRESHAANCQR